MKRWKALTQSCQHPAHQGSSSLALFLLCAKKFCMHLRYWIQGNCMLYLRDSSKYVMDQLILLLLLTSISSLHTGVVSFKQTWIFSIVEWSDFEQYLTAMLTFTSGASTAFQACGLGTVFWKCPTEWTLHSPVSPGEQRSLGSPLLPEECAPCCNIKPATFLLSAWTDQEQSCVMYLKW